MAVLITNGTGVNNHDANAFYRVEAHNLTGWYSAGAPTQSVLTTKQRTSLTFANAGNFKGAVFSFLSLSAICDRNIITELREGATVLLPTASPGVATLATHGFVEGQLVEFTTTGTLPTGLVANTPYYVRNPATNTFNVSATPTGALINFTGSPAGTHTVWKIIADKTTPRSFVHNNVDPTATRPHYGMYITNLENWSATPAVDTTARKYRFVVYSSGGTIGTLYLTRGGSVNTQTAMMYAAYCDTLATFTDNDTCIRAHYTKITQSATLAGVLGLNDTTYGVAGIICSNTVAHNTDNVCYLSVEGGPITLTLKGSIARNKHAGIKVGTEDNEIDPSKQFTLVSDIPNVGTATCTIRNYHNTNSSTNYYPVGTADFLHGKLADGFSITATTASTEEQYRSHIQLSQPLASYGWAVGDTVFYSKQRGAGQGTVTNMYKILGTGYKDITPRMTANNAPSPYVAAASTTTTNYFAYEAFDCSNSAGASWRSTVATASRLRLDMGAGNSQIVTGYSLWCGLDTPRAPRDWTFQGSDDATTWTTLDTQTGVTTWTEWNFYSFANTTPYRYYRISMTANNGGATYQITEMKLFETANEKYLALDWWGNAAVKPSGAIVQNHTPKYYGIHLTNNTSTLTSMGGLAPNAYTVTGAYGYGLGIGGQTPITTVGTGDDDNAISKLLFKDICYRPLTNAATALIASNIRVNEKGMEINNIHTMIASPRAYGAGGSIIVSGFSSGEILVKDCTSIGVHSTAMGHGGKNKVIFENITIQGKGSTAATSMFAGNGINSVFRNITLWGDAVNAFPDETTGTGALAFTTATIGNTYENIKIDNCNIGIFVGASGVGSNNTFDDVIMQGESVNSYDYFVQPGAFNEFYFNNSNFYRQYFINKLVDATDGFRMSFINYYDQAKEDFTRFSNGDIYRTGPGLRDETVRTAGGYAMRFNNAIYGSPLIYKFNIPTGNIQGKDMAVGVWCKIKSDKYYDSAFDYKMPQLTIKYDNGLNEVYAEAAQSTDWQLLFAPFSPATEFGQVTVEVSTNSGAGYRGDLSADYTVADPAVFTLNGHGFTGGEMVYFNTDETMPTGLLADFTYYVKYIDENTFSISETYDGTNIAITAAGAGTLDMYTFFDVAVVFDDFSVFYPPGVTLNLGAIDLWSNGLPIGPPISTGVNAADVWAYPETSATVTGSMGVVVTTIKKRVGWLRSLL